MRRVTIAVLLIGILTISTFPRAAVAQSAPWIDSSKATQYATDLIGNYTNLVNQKLRYYANFSVYEPFLTLYAATGHTFNVTVLKTYPNDTSGLANFVFDEIGGNGPPPVKIENVTTASDLLHGGEWTSVGGVELPIFPDTFAYEYISINYTAGYDNIKLVLVAPVADVDNATMTAPANVALAVLQSDQEAAAASPFIGSAHSTVVPKPSIWETIKAGFDYLVLGVAAAIATFVGLYLQIKDRRRNGRNRRH